MRAMGKKRPERTERRTRERAVRQLVRDKEKLARLVAGGSAERPIQVDSSAVIEIRVRSFACPLCEGRYRVDDHVAPSSGRREVIVTCQQCGIRRSLWFRLVTDEPN